MNKNARNPAPVSLTARAESSLLKSVRRIVLAMWIIVGLMQIVQHFQYNDLRINLFLLAESVGGYMVFQSAENSGTTITLTVPLMGSGTDYLFPVQKDRMGAFNSGNRGQG